MPTKHETTLSQKIPPVARLLGARFAAHGFPLYIVGGFVRNTLLGLPFVEMDMTGPALPQQVLPILEGLPNIHIFTKGIRYGTLEIHITEASVTHIIEYTPFRQDTYAQGTHRPTSVSFGVSLLQDAQRRDFSINALYYDIEKNELRDPVDGLSALAQKRIHTTTQDPLLVLKDDGLRLLRLIRFACQLKFDIDPLVFSAAQAHVQWLSDISKERIRDELIKILLSDTAYPQLTDDTFGFPPRRGLHLLHQMDALPYILPDLAAGDGVAQRKDYHAHDVLCHNIEVMCQLPPVLRLRLAGLLHDVAKPMMLQKNGTMHGHDKEGAFIAEKLLGQKGLKFDKQTVSFVSRLIACHMYDLNNKAKEATVRRYFIKIGLNVAGVLPLFRQADVIGSGRTTAADASAQKFSRILSDMQKQDVPFSLSDLAISGDDVMALLKEGPSLHIGRILSALHEKVIENPTLNQKESLLRLVKPLSAQLSQKKDLST